MSTLTMNPKKRGRKLKPENEKVKLRSVYLNDKDFKQITNTYGSLTNALRCLKNNNHD